MFPVEMYVQVDLNTVVQLKGEKVKLQRSAKGNLDKHAVNEMMFLRGRCDA